MASLAMMTWSKADKRWHKGYRGRRYAVSPKQLDRPATKEQSRTAANDWWTAKQKEIDEALGKAKQHPPMSSIGMNSPFAIIGYTHGGIGGKANRGSDQERSRHRVATGGVAKRRTALDRRVGV